MTLYEGLSVHLLVSSVPRFLTAEFKPKSDLTSINAPAQRSRLMLLCIRPCFYKDSVYKDIRFELLPLPNFYTAPAHPHATDAAVYTALFYYSVIANVGNNETQGTEE